MDSSVSLSGQNNFPTCIVSPKKLGENPNFNNLRWPRKLGSSFKWGSRKGSQSWRIVEFRSRGTPYGKFYMEPLNIMSDWYQRVKRGNSEPPVVDIWFGQNPKEHLFFLRRTSFCASAFLYIFSQLWLEEELEIGSAGVRQNFECGKTSLEDRTPSIFRPPVRKTIVSSISCGPSNIVPETFLVLKNIQAS